MQYYLTLRAGHTCIYLSQDSLKFQGKNVDHLGEDISRIKVPIFPSRLSIGVERGLRSTSPVLQVFIDEFIKNLIVLEEYHI